MQCLTEYRGIYIVECVAKNGNLIFRRYVHTKQGAIRVVKRSRCRVLEGCNLRYYKLDNADLKSLKYVDVED